MRLMSFELLLLAAATPSRFSRSDPRSGYFAFMPQMRGSSLSDERVSVLVCAPAASLAGRLPLPCAHTRVQARSPGICGGYSGPVVLVGFVNDLGAPVAEVSPERVREKLVALTGQLSEGDVIKLLTELLAVGGGVSLEIDELRVKLIRREGHFALKDGRTHSSLPPRSGRPR